MIAARLAENAALVEKALSVFTAEQDADFAAELEAERYALLSRAKRIRPTLVLEFCRLFDGKDEAALPFACAVEMIHTYSLIHDDLPCMDDDDMRRGKPSCHKVYGEAVALLAGDALLTLAFGTIAQCKTVSADKIAAAAAELARLSGAAGMVGGQVIDLDSEGKSVPIETLRVLDAGKTCALIEAACVLGCICADADEAALSAARKYASGVGMAFQIVDDILDVTGDEAILGKPVESDAGNNKSTYVSLMGIEGASAEARRYTQEATAALDVLGGECEFLKDFAQKLLYRIS